METDKVHALLVMDEVESTQLALSLTKHNIEAYKTSRVRQAVNFLDQYNKVDVILTDLDFPEGDGEQFLRYLQSSQRLKRIPVIAYTAIVERDRVVWITGLGVHDFLLRPCREEVLIKKINQVVDSGIGSILIVDDEPTIRDLLAHIVEREGYRVVVADNGREALEMLNRQKISLVVTDLMMPEMNGMELLVEVTEAAREDAIGAGADGYITKPFKNLEISQRIESLVRAGTSSGLSARHKKTGRPQ